VAEVEIRAGAKLNLLNQSELDQSLSKQDAQVLARLNATKPVRLPLITGKATGGVLLIGGDSAPETAPASGYVWSIRHLVVEGLTAGTTPDVVNIVRGNRIIWQLNGNQFAQTWGRGEVLLFAGETLAFQSVGTFTSTATVIVHGLAQEEPAQLVGKLYT